MIQKVEAGAGLNWLSGGWKAFTKSGLALIGMGIVAIILIAILVFIPLIGVLLVPIVANFFYAGVLLGLREQATGGSLRFDHLFSAFKAGDKLVHIAIVAVVSLLGSLLSQALQGSLAGNLLGFLVSLSFSALTFFAIPLVLFRNQDAVSALKWSLNGVLANIPAVIVFWILMIIIGFLAILPIGLGLIVALPVFVGAAYEAYAEVFGDAELDPNTPAAPQPPLAPPPPPVA